MAVLKAYGPFVLLHGTFFLIVMFLILAVFERGRRRADISIMAVSAIAPFFLISYGALGLLLVFPSLGRYSALVSAFDIKLVLVLPILWLYFKINAKLAVIYTILLLVAAQFSPVFVRAVLQLFDGKPGAFLSLSMIAAVLVAAWIAMCRIEDSAARMFARCVMIAALVAPTLIVGHGGAIILPAGMVWPNLFEGGVDMVIQFVSLAIGMTITTAVLVLTYKYIARIQSEIPADKTEGR